MGADGIGGGQSQVVCGRVDHGEGLGSELLEWYTLIFLKDFCACCGDWTVEGPKSKQRDYLEDHWSGHPARGGCALRMGQGQR